MKGSGLFTVLGSNNFAVGPQQGFGKTMNRRGLMCWKCQQTKPRQGGSEKMMAGFTNSLRRFICKDCVEAKQRSLKLEE